MDKQAVILREAQAPRVLHRLPGRIRVNVGDAQPQGPGSVEASLLDLNGVHRARVNPATGNALVEFDPSATSEIELLAVICARTAGAPGRPPTSDPFAPHAGSHPGLRRAHIAGKDVAETHLARQVARRLRALPNVSRASSETDGVVVDYSGDDAVPSELVAEVARARADAERERGGEGTSAIRLAEAALELTVFAVRRVRDGERLSRIGAVSLAISGALGAVEAVPPLRSALRRRLGETGSEIVLDSIEAVGLGLSGGWLGWILCAVKVAKLVDGAANPVGDCSCEDGLGQLAPVVVTEGTDVSVCELAGLAEAA